MEKLPAIHEGYHDKEIIGSSYDKINERLTLVFAHEEKLVFNEIVQFELNFFSDQNVVFDIEKYTTDDIPETLIDDYPFLESYKRDHQVLIYYINASVGMSGIIICKS